MIWLLSSSKRPGALASLLKNAFEDLQLFGVSVGKHSGDFRGMLPEDWNNSGLYRSLLAPQRAPSGHRVFPPRLTSPFSSRRSTATLMEPGVRWTFGPMVFTGRGPLCRSTSST